MLEEIDTVLRLLGCSKTVVHDPVDGTPSEEFRWKFGKGGGAFYGSMNIKDIYDHTFSLYGLTTDEYHYSAAASGIGSGRRSGE